VAVIARSDEDGYCYGRNETEGVSGNVFAKTDGYTDTGLTKNAKRCVPCLSDQQSAAFTRCF
jgi:hypothetical protein